MATRAYGPNVNLDNLRSQLADRAALLLSGAGVVLIWAVLPREPFSLPVCGLLGALAALGALVHVLNRCHPPSARYLLVCGLTGWLLAAMALFAAPWLPLLALAIIFLNAMLITGGELATGAAVAASLLWLQRSGARLYPLEPLLVALVLGAALAWLAVRTLYKALEWAWTMQERADKLLELARDRQGELNKALKSLDLSASLLRHAQHELIAARRQAEEARMMKERFAASVSHELRTPLSIILGFSEMIYVSPEVYGPMRWPPKLRRAVYQIYRNSRHLLEMIDDVLDLSRFEMVGFTLNREATPPEALLREAAGIAAGFFQGRAVQLVMEAEKGLPALHLDRTRMRQVLLNLLNNAARFTEQGVVRIQARRSGGEILFSVSDSGPGIPADRLQRIFDEFYRVDVSANRKHSGFGLGLAICKRFVEAHEGRIWAESKEGVGSTFYFTVPLPDRRPPAPPLRVERPLEPSPEVRPCILVVDPDPEVAALVRRHVGEYEVVQVEGMDQLVQEAARRHPRAVVHNLAPWEEPGREALLPLPVPVIECSLPSQAWVAGELGVAACLTKPFTTDRLLQAIGRLGAVHDVLIVDDDRGFCQLVEQMLEAGGRGLALRHAYDGEEGLRAIAARRPDLLLLDIVMPGMDGFGVLKGMRQRLGATGVPVVLLTATSYVEDALEQRGSKVLIRRPHGLSVPDVLRCLRATIGAIEPRYYDGRPAPEPSLRYA